MLIRTPSDIPSSEITSETSYMNRRQLLQSAGLGATGLLLGNQASANKHSQLRTLKYQAAGLSMQQQGYFTTESLTPFKDVTSYNNFYEFGTSKSDPARLAPQLLQTEPWSIQVSGLVNKPGKLNLEDILQRFPLQERVYRLRCVEAWSMVIPWVGFPLADLIRYLEPSAKAKYIAFETLADPKQMPGIRSVSGLIDWPYQEGLRLDEAMHDLTLLAVGVYGKEILPQNGAPIRLVVPWKYGFKSIKSIVGIRFTDKQPATSWQQTAPSEYGFYANVNPAVDHPRWSQATERRLPAGIFDFTRQKTQLFNGYADQVAGLYKGMNLQRYF